MGIPVVTILPLSRSPHNLQNDQHVSEQNLCFGKPTHRDIPSAMAELTPKDPSSQVCP
jgi:hypothetical protein